jgi:hypothetical protein
MTKLGVKDGEPLVVDLTGRSLASWDDLWDALEVACQLPEWFGRNLDAWKDTVEEGGISALLDSHPTVIIRLSAEGLFAPGNRDGEAFIEVTERTGEGQVEVQ